MKKATQNSEPRTRNPPCLYACIPAILILLLSAPSISTAATKTKQDTTKSPTLVLESADMNENSFSKGELVSVLRGHVVFSYDSVLIHSGEATWWRSKGIILFEKGVRVERQRQSLTCDRMHFTKETDLLTAEGHFNYYDTTGKTRLLGRNGDYHLGNKVFHLTGDPRLVRYDTVTAETLTITGIRMTYVDSIKCATVIDKVHIKKGKLSSTCGLARYYTEKNTAELRGSPHVKYEINKVDGDSINLCFGKESLKNATVMGHSHGLYIDTSGNSATPRDSSRSKIPRDSALAKATRDTMLTHIWSDSLFMTVSDSGFMDSLWAYGKVRSKYFSTSDSATANEAKGKTMRLAFSRSGNLDNIRIWGNARSIYFIEDKGGEGRNEASGDTIAVTFGPDGKAKKLSLMGSARGVYYPQMVQKN